MDKTIAEQARAMSAALKSIKVTDKAFCRAAGINQANWVKWKKGQSSPLAEKWLNARKVYAQFFRAEQERIAAAANAEARRVLAVIEEAQEGGE